MTYRRAESLTTLVDQVNKAVPDRDKSSDGWIGDESHQNTNSDHNPWIWDDATDMWVVSAQDITNDPAGGCSSRALAESLVAGKDDRIKYVISDEEICSGTGQDHTAWQWRPYTGSNPHTEHMHLSVKSDKAHYDDTRQWKNKPAPVGPVPPQKPKLPVLRFGDKGPQVKFLQQQLIKEGYEIRLDSDFGPNTQKAVEAFQFESGLTVDGIVGQYTWEALLGPQLPVSTIKETGKVSWFGGPQDTDGVSEQEGLAFIFEINKTNQHLFLPINDGTGLARQLNPHVHYFAYRFDYKIHPKEMLASMKYVAFIRNVATGKTLTAFPADWGPHGDTERILDLSKGLLDDLGLKTDGLAEIVFPAPIGGT